MNGRGKSFYHASAGTGKTYTIVERVGEFLFTIDLDRILIVTYTEKATGELKNRIREKIESIKDEGVRKRQLSLDDRAPIYTIHSFCKAVLDEYAFLMGQPFALSGTKADEFDCFVDRWIIDRDISVPAANQYDSSYKKDLTAAVSKFYLTLDGETDDEIVSMEKPTGDDEKKMERSLFAYRNTKDLYLSWENEKKRRREQDFSDMIRFVREAIKDKEFLSLLQSKYEYAVIDEFQDTNMLQWDIFRTIFSHDNIMVVGDEKQSIFSFQGADVSVFKMAEDSFREDERKNLSENYRATPLMIDAVNRMFADSNNLFFSDASGVVKYPGDERNRKKNAEWRKGPGDYEVAKPVWTTGEPTDQYAFASFAASLIVDSMTEEDGKTALRVNKDPHDKTKLDNVTFSDFVVLARTRTEMEEIEGEMKKRGIPFIRYKDTRLFSGIECMEWISLLRAIDTDDYGGKNAKILSEALYTRFFGKSLSEIADNAQGKVSTFSREKELLRIWAYYAGERKWAHFIESIFQESDIERTLSDRKLLQTLTVFRQLGSYIYNYLQNNNATLSDLLRHLERVSKNSDEAESSDDEGNYVEIGTDIDAVRVMTIHASKGLQFPVVISVAGFKGRSNQETPVSVNRNDRGEPKLHFNKTEENVWQEEVKRLIYVANTRATSILVLPYYYDNTLKYDQKYKTWIKNFFTNSTDLLEKIPYERDDRACYSSSTLKPGEGIGDQDYREEERRRFSDTVGRMKTEKYSYSSLAHGGASVPVILRETDYNMEEEEEEDGELILSSSIAPPPGYPKGAKVGNALHSILEKIDFVSFTDETIMDLAEEAFLSEGLKYPKKDEEWKEYTLSIIQNTLFASLPALSTPVSPFTLGKNIKREMRRSEAEFFINPLEKWQRKFINGFIDLMFQWEGKYYLLDWKSNLLEGNIYRDKTKLEEITDELYGIQYTLYSYTLIRWLETFHKDMDFGSIYDKFFGGMYYVYLRGTRENTEDGIFYKRWNDWNELEASFSLIKERIEKEDDHE